jgi:hypothetical protein
MAVPVGGHDLSVRDVRFSVSLPAPPIALEART